MPVLIINSQPGYNAVINKKKICSSNYCNDLQGNIKKEPPGGEAALIKYH
jgi:hypothetical protein